MGIVRVRFNELTEARVVGTIVDRTGTLVPASALSAATLTLYDVDTYVPGASPVEGVLNGRNVQDVLGSGSPASINGVTIYDTLQTDADGSTYSFEWLLEPADNVIVTTRRQVERHRAMFVFTWSDGEARVELEIEVVNLRAAA